MTSDLPLPVDAIDLDSLVLARNDAHPDGDWWFDPRTGETLYHGIDDDADLPALRGGEHVLVPRDPQPLTDIDEFLSTVDDEEEAARLYAAFHRKGGARRFRELVARGPLAPAWTEFTVRREAARAIDWLLERGLVERASGIEHRDRLLG